jgi:hypothetical protein
MASPSPSHTIASSVPDVCALSYRSLPLRFICLFQTVTLTAKRGADMLMEFAVDAKLSTEVEVNALKAQLGDAVRRLELFDNYLVKFSTAMKTKGVNPDIDRRIADWHHRYGESA